MTDYESVPGLLVSHDEQVLRLAFDHAERRNALDDEMVAAMIDAIDAAGRDEAVRVIVLAGAGEHFCGGADIVARNAAGRATPRPGSAASSAGCRRRPTG